MDMIEFASGYFVNSNGEVFSNKSGEMKQLNGSVRNGYKVIGIIIDGKQQFYLAHRLVAEAFIPNPEHKPIINHKDGNKLNNCVDNLEWCTYRENTQHAWDIGLIKSNSKETIEELTENEILEKLLSEYQKKQEEVLEAEENLLLFYFNKFNTEQKIIGCFIAQLITKLAENQFSYEQIRKIQKLSFDCLAEWENIDELIKDSKATPL